MTCFVQQTVQNPKDIQLAAALDKEKQKLLTFEKQKLGELLGVFAWNMA